MRPSRSLVLQHPWIRLFAADRVCSSWTPDRSLAFRVNRIEAEIVKSMFLHCDGVILLVRDAE
jgi:hypothetical protein